MFRSRLFRLFVPLLACAAVSQAADKKVLVYTRNYTPPDKPKGFVHDNVTSGVEAVQKLGRENGFAVDVSDDPKVFTPESLHQYAALVFSNSNNEAFENEAQRQAFKKYIQGGGGFVGVHSASGSERAWDYYWQALGGKFKFHPKQQKLELKVLEPESPIAQAIPATFTWGPDECYFHDRLNPDIKVVVAADPAQIPDKRAAQTTGSLVGGLIPLVWYQTFDGGREVYIALGHNIPMYQDPILTRLILNAIKWSMGEDKSPPGKPTKEYGQGEKKKKS